MSEAELLAALAPEHFRKLERGDRYRILAQVGANPPPALAEARYEALKIWLPQNRRQTMTLRGLRGRIRCWLFGHSPELYRRGRSWQTRCKVCHDPYSYTLGDRLQQLRQWRPRLPRWGKRPGSDEMPF